MVLNKKNYKYLLQLYSRVGEYLQGADPKKDDLPEIIVYFCIIVEKIFKIKLHQKNPVLVFDNCKIKENDALLSIVNIKELDIETIKIREVIGRYKLVFEKEFSDEELQVILDIYNIRNHFVHSYKADGRILFDSENVVTKMGTVWEKISKQAIDLFGKVIIKANKPKKKYTETELEEVLKKEIEKKIKKQDTLYGITFPYEDHVRYSFTLGGEECPRCGSYGFSIEDSTSNVFNPTISLYSKGMASDLYKCKKCYLELTRKEYEIAKKLKEAKNDF